MWSRCRSLNRNSVNALSFSIQNLNNDTCHFCLFVCYNKATNTPESLYVFCSKGYAHCTMRKKAHVITISYLFPGPMKTPLFYVAWTDLSHYLNYIEIGVPLSRRENCLDQKTSAFSTCSLLRWELCLAVVKNVLTILFNWIEINGVYRKALNKLGGL